jgi:tetratricopeptide (TPR) repeat protein/S1-C subfamily serine protease
MKTLIFLHPVLLWTVCSLPTLLMAESATPKTVSRPPLILAVERGQRADVDRFIRNGADLEMRTTDGVTPLYAAAFHGRAEILRRLIAAGAKVDGRAALGRTALFTAAAEGHPRAVEILLESGADPNARSDPGELVQTPLHAAAIEGKLETARLLLNRGAEVNTQSDRHHITPLYLAVIAGHNSVAALLLERGADAALTDIYGQTPASAAAVLAERKTRRLIEAGGGRIGFDPRAIVVMPYLGFSLDRRSYRGNRLAVVIGDGSLVVTAAHCLDDFIEAREKSTLARPLVISPYFGDLFEAEIVGVDTATDVALLKVKWDGHPALALAEEEDFSLATELLVAGYPLSEEAEGRSVRIPTVSAERLPVLQIGGSAERNQIILGGARFIGPGWSGAAMILPDNGRLAGIFGSKEDLSTDDLVVLQNRMGGSARAIRALIDAYEKKIHKPPNSWRSIKNAAEASSIALEWLNAQAGRPPVECLQAAERLVKLRPESALAHWLLAISADSNNASAAEKEFREAVRLAPESLLIRASYGAFLDQQKRAREALAELDVAERLEPANQYVNALQLKILENFNPEQAQEFGRRLVKEHSKNAVFWFHYAGALRRLGRTDEALEAAQSAVRLAPEELFWYRGRLADLLAGCGRIEEADACYIELLRRDQQSAVFWLWYAEFLARRQPERQDDLRRALNRCEALNLPPRVPQTAIDQLRAKLRDSAGPTEPKDH